LTGVISGIERIKVNKNKLHLLIGLKLSGGYKKAGEPIQLTDDQTE